MLTHHREHPLAGKNTPPTVGRKELPRRPWAPHLSTCFLICAVCGYQRSLPLPTMCRPPHPLHPCKSKSSLVFTLPGIDSNVFSGPHLLHHLWSKHTTFSKKPPISSEGLQSSWHEEWAKSLPTLSPTLRRDQRCAKAAASAQNSQNSRMQNQPAPSPFPVPLSETPARSYLQSLTS